MKEGFDMIVGNPPYVERSKLNYPTALFNINDCGNTYAYFFEILLKILNSNGYLGFIVPVLAFLSIE
jgi:methylase of polypeptide subunit release factors